MSDRQQVAVQVRWGDWELHVKRILVVDDERQIVRMLRASLEAAGYDVSTAENGVNALSAMRTQGSPDLIVTDLAMPEMNGLELTRAVRRITQVPIIVLSVRDSDAMKVEALDEGADDYLTKPFSVPELLARIRAQLRRADSSGLRVSARIELGEFSIDEDAHIVEVRGVAVHLTPKEFDLLLLFARSPGRVLTHKSLLKAVWGPSAEGQPEYLRVLIAALRKKIEVPNGTRYIHSEPWVGYRFDPRSLPNEF